MFYKFDEKDRESFNELLLKLDMKLKDLEDKSEQIFLNKAKHLKECKNSILACLNNEDKDEFDYFIYDIYTLTWGYVPKEIRATLNKEEHSEYFDEVFERVDKYDKNILSLKELACGILKDRVDLLIKNSDKYQQRLIDYDEFGIPRKITIRQAKLALLEVGLLETIETMVQNAPKATQISWEYATEFERHHPLILNFQEQMNLKDEEVDKLFKRAKEL
ncbi:hypothetical protein KJK83_001802 [Campylobacter jejuni]|nr:hypothetical protein [Campylobacter jejuni]EHN6903048.1 hypothetical protein [Campylobacter jejuni]EHN6916758.1 hypothetical protein [Campylobacter jejuni]